MFILLESCKYWSLWSHSVDSDYIFFLEQLLFALELVIALYALFNLTNTICNSSPKLPLELFSSQ